MHKNTEKPFQNKKKKSIVWKYFEYNPNELILFIIDLKEIVYDLIEVKP